MSSTMPAPVIPSVLEQHVEELTSLWAVRDGLCEAPHIRLRDLARFDERIAAHTDGCVLAGQHGSAMLTANLADVSASRVFAAAVVAFELADTTAIARCVALAEATAEAQPGLASAVGWVSATCLKGIVRDLLGATSAFQRTLGLAACRLHGVDPGSVLVEAVKGTDGATCSAAIRTAGSLGLRDFASVPAAEGTNDECRFWFAWTRVLLGDRDRAVSVLAQTATVPGLHRARAFAVALQSMNSGAAHSLLKDLAGDSSQLRWLIRGSGIAGDPGYVPWLVGQMRDDKSARLAGEAFTLISGADLEATRLGRPKPEGFEPSPTDNPDDDNVDMDQDEGLPWPDVEKIEKWWAANASRFHKGQRYFMGAPVTREHCLDVLKNGHQRQRILAAHYLCLLNPGTPLFNTSAPAWRQQRLLARM